MRKCQQLMHKDVGYISLR